MATIINDVTTLNPIEVDKVVQFATQSELIEFIKTTDVTVSIAGGRFSMGGQTASRNTVNIDMRLLNRIVKYEPSKQLIRVECGCTWFEIQKHINPDNLAVKIMQTYSNFTVGGSLSVNCHGRYIGFGPVIGSVKKIKVLLPKGEVIIASPKRNKKIFFSVIGCYNAVAIILEAELELVGNTKVRQLSQRMDFKEYLTYFVENIRDNKSVVFHNADIFTDTYKQVNAVSWLETDENVTVSDELIQRNKSYKINQYFVWAFTETPFGKWRRRCIYNPLYFKIKRVHWRNYEASYDVLELQPKSRDDSTYVLQEYFIPVDRLYMFADIMVEIFKRYNVNVLNVSIRHAKQDMGSKLAWAKGEVFCFVVYYKEYKRPQCRVDTPVWTRELMEASVKCEGSFYLPYQPHAGFGLFQKAYPEHQALFDMKKDVDKNYRFRNALWDKFYKAWLNPSEARHYRRENEFDLFDDPEWYDKIFLFLQNVFDIHEPKVFMHLLCSVRETQRSPRDIYNSVLQRLGECKSIATSFRALKSLKKQKMVMAGQMNEYKGYKQVDAYLEIGTTGRYVNSLRKLLPFGKSEVDLMHDVAPQNTVIDIVERAQLGNSFGYIKTKDYATLQPNKYDLITCFAGLHHFDLDKLGDVISSIVTSLKAGGVFALREHDCATQNMKVFVSLIHSIFNIGTEEPEQVNHDEVRLFKSVDEWIKLLAKYGMHLECEPKYQDFDPSKNALLIFKKSDV